jgi:hypothetical protein
MSDPIFRCSLLPARQGDCLWLEYGPADHPHQVLIDGGVADTHTQVLKRLNNLPADRRDFELLIISHIDSDHIGGTLELLLGDSAGATFKDVWFNGWRHLPESGFEEFGPVQGEKLTTRLLQPGTNWNQSTPFAGKAVSIKQNNPLPSVELEGGLKLTLLSPGTEQLHALRPVWQAECIKAGLFPPVAAVSSHPIPPGFEVMGTVTIEQLAQAKYKGDPSPANGSSIAILADYCGVRLLLAGDAHAEVLTSSLQRLTAAGEKLQIKAFKLPHHGSQNNLSQSLLEKIDCPLYLFSTDGTQFKHPSPQAVARVIKFGGSQPTLAFNYRTDYTLKWKHQPWIDQYGYSVLYPPEGETGLVVDLI